MHSLELKGKKILQVTIAGFNKAHQFNTIIFFPLQKKKKIKERFFPLAKSSIKWIDSGPAITPRHFIHKLIFYSPYMPPTMPLILYTCHRLCHWLATHQKILKFNIKILNYFNGINKNATKRKIQWTRTWKDNKPNTFNL